MSWELLKSILIGLGGLSLVSGLVVIISKTLAEHISKKKIQEYISQSIKELEKFKSEISKKEKYSHIRFELYNTLWSSLVDLKSKADELWGEVTNDSLKEFSKMLKKTEIEIEKSRLLLDFQDYDALIQIIRGFKNYQIGKKKILDINNKKSESLAQDFGEYFGQALSNFKTKQEYNSLLDRLSLKFKTNIEGTLE